MGFPRSNRLLTKASFETSLLSTSDELNSRIEFLRLDATRRLQNQVRTELGQFLTPAPVARMMASMFVCSQPLISILDAGAGVGTLFAAMVAELCSRSKPPKEIKVVAYEIDTLLIEYLEDTLSLCGKICEEKNIIFKGEIRASDFIKDVAQSLKGRLFVKQEEFTCAIVNPPYRKINVQSEARELLRSIGLETSNLYTGFLATAVKMLAPEGELVAISPRSFCNGPYFRPFRELFLREMAFERLHLFNSREKAFNQEILQETIIFHALKTYRKPKRIIITSSESAEDEMFLSRELQYDEVIQPNDPEQFIRIMPDNISQQVTDRMSLFSASLEELGLSVSTGRVVDFRAKPYLRQKPNEETAPLIYPTNFERGGIRWPKEGRKPQALVMAKETESLFVPNDNYVLVKRFSSKEEKRRIVAAVYEAERLHCLVVGFENHINYYHQNGKGLDRELARGLAAFLNSTIVDSFFRQFNGHTQVNATDLRSFKYPGIEDIRRIGSYIQDEATQEEIDSLLQREIFVMTNSENDPIAVKRRIDEALEILVLLGLPRAQLNERSALTLLAFVGLGPYDTWAEATHPRLGITPIMEFMAEKYGKLYKPNTRETVRRFTVHQFLDAGLVIINPDKPERPPNSPKTIYEIEPDALALLCTYGKPEWERNLKLYLASVETLKKRYAQEREMARIPIQIAEGHRITLSPGGQNVLIKEIIEEFAPRFTPGGKLIYIGDTDEKFAYFDRESLSTLGVEVEDHGKIPDVIIHFTEKDWLILIEAVTSHGPINPKRKIELEKLFKHSRAGLVLVTAFLSRKAMVEYLPEISWESEVWVAESPSHLIHFNGERFLGPY